MKLAITVALLSIVSFLFAQSDTPNKQKYVLVKKNGKTVGVSIVDANADSVINLDNSKAKGGFAPMTDVYRPGMTFWKKCKYFILSFKRQNAFMFWSLVVIIGFWLLRFLFKLFDR
jgi:hypothetical protein